MSLPALTRKALSFAQRRIWGAEEPGRFGDLESFFGSSLVFLDAPDYIGCVVWMMFIQMILALF
jgi:hypothetical protein